MRSMSTSSTLDVLSRFLDPVAECLTADVARRIVDLRLDPQVQSRLDELAERSSDGTLTDEERAEYQAYVEGLDVIGIIKAKARRTLSRRAS